MFPPFLFSWRVFKNLYSFFFKCLVEFTREASWAQDFLWIGFGYSFNLFMSIPIFYFFLNQFQSFVCFWEFVGFSYYLIYWHRVRSIRLKFFFFNFCKVSGPAATVSTDWAPGSAQPAAGLQGFCKNRPAGVSTIQNPPAWDLLSWNFSSQVSQDVLAF